MKIQENVQLASYTTLNVGGAARYFVSVNTIETLQDALGFARAHALSVCVLGGGSNVVIADSGFDGLIIHMEVCGITYSDTTDNGMTVRAAAGEVWDDLVLLCVEKGMRGLESMSGIPGSVGAAIVGNIAAYGQAVSDTLTSVDVLDTDDPSKGLKRIPVSQLGLRYRYSDFQNEKLSSNIIVYATFMLNTKVAPKLEYRSALRVAEELDLDFNNIQEHRQIILEARRRAGSLLSSDMHTAGSFFRNPEVSEEVAKKILDYEEFGVSKEGILRQNKIHGGTATRVSAAHVLLAAGFERGQRWGDVRLHPKHILKIENTDNATAQDIYDVSTHIVATVKKKLGIQLEPEVRFIGTFKKSSNT